MHRPHLLLLLLSVLALLSFLAISIERNGIAQEEDPYPPCSPPGRLPDTNGASWAKNAPVKVVINSNDFPPNSTQRAAVEAAFTAWQNANTNSGVTEEDSGGAGGGGAGGCSGCSEVTCPGQCFGDCCTQTPVVIDVLGNGFNLTNPSSGVAFDLNVDGTREQLSWTSPGSDDAWLALDRNGNSTIDNGAELFGEFTPQPEPLVGQRKNGFIALAEFDKPANGGNGDGIIGASDAVFSLLWLWRDSNQNGISEASELYTFSAVGLAQLDLNYKESRRTDEHGNRFRYRAKVKNSRGQHRGRWAWDVYLVTSL